MEFHLELTPNSLSGKVATHTAIAAPDSRAPAKALISLFNINFFLYLNFISVYIGATLL